MSVAVYVNKSASKIAKPIVEDASKASGATAARIAAAMKKDAAKFGSEVRKSVHYKPTGITKAVSYYATELPSTKTYFGARKLLIPIFRRFSTTPEIDSTAAAALIATPVYWAGTAVTATVSGIVDLGKGVGRLARYLTR